jgi:hypothetical protein
MTNHHCLFQTTCLPARCNSELSYTTRGQIAWSHLVTTERFDTAQCSFGLSQLPLYTASKHLFSSTTATACLFGHFMRLILPTHCFTQLRKRINRERDKETRDRDCKQHQSNQSCHFQLLLPDFNGFWPLSPALTTPRLLFSRPTAYFQSPIPVWTIYTRFDHIWSLKLSPSRFRAFWTPSTRFRHTTAISNSSTRFDPYNVFYNRKRPFLVANTHFSRQHQFWLSTRAFNY